MATGRPANDAILIQIVDQALAQTAARSGDWLVCRSGCWQCCVGVFAINALDAARLRTGMDSLRQQQPHRAGAIEERVHSYIERTQDSFPGDRQSGILGEDEASLSAFENFANDEVCPVLDPETKSCDLYGYRPMTCRVFGPPVQTGEGLGVCELCYHGATPEEIAACEMIPDADGLEAELLASMADSDGIATSTTIAYALSVKPA